MALVWAHAEHIKLCRSLPDDRFFDQPPQAMERYIFEKTDSLYRARNLCRVFGDLRDRRNGEMDAMSIDVQKEKIYTDEDMWRNF